MLESLPGNPPGMRKQRKHIIWLTGPVMAEFCNLGSSHWVVLVSVKSKEQSINSLVPETCSNLRENMLHILVCRIAYCDLCRISARRCGLSPPSQAVERHNIKRCSIASATRHYLCLCHLNVPGVCLLAIGLLRYSFGEELMPFLLCGINYLLTESEVMQGNIRLRL